jgi:hypothetical protein
VQSRESERFSRSGAAAANLIKTKEKVGGRDRDRTGDPLLAKQTGKNTKGFVWCRLHGKLAKSSLSSCTEVVPNRPGFETEKEGVQEGKEWDINGRALRPREK